PASAPTPAPAPSRPPSTTAPQPPSARRPFYRNAIKSISEKKTTGTSLVELTLLLTVPAVLAAALLRPRSASRRSR
ncbi:hypothetical protein ACSNOH_15680, partial [Streptomyces sp. URMC 127]